MKSLAIVLASMAIVLLNMSLGWALAKQHSRGQWTLGLGRWLGRDESGDA